MTDLAATGVTALRFSVFIDVRSELDLRSQALDNPRFLNAEETVIHLANTPIAIDGKHGAIGIAKDVPHWTIDLTSASHLASVTIDTSSVWSS